jgi:hypothetical protein
VFVAVWNEHFVAAVDSQYVSSKGMKPASLVPLLGPRYSFNDLVILC